MKLIIVLIISSFSFFSYGEEPSLAGDSALNGGVTGETVCGFVDEVNETPSSDVSYVLLRQISDYVEVKLRLRMELGQTNEVGSFMVPKVYESLAKLAKGNPNLIFCETISYKDTLYPKAWVTLPDLQANF